MPAVFVTAGASAALTLATAACVAGDDAGYADSLPHIKGPRRRVVIQRGHRDPYDHAVTAVGVELTEVGYPTSTRPDELVRELDGTVAAVLWRPGRAGDLLPLELVAQLCHAVAVPVIVDAAMDIPPVERLHAVLAAGADAVAISGGKGFRGPHTSGILGGRSDLVRAVALHHLDMDVRDQTWSPSEVTGVSAPHGRHGIARGMKVGREQVLGLMQAISEYTADPGRHETLYQDELSSLEEELQSVPGLRTRRTRNHHLDVPETAIELAGTGRRADTVVRELDAGEPRIHVGEDEAWRDIITVNPMGLHRGEGRSIGARIFAILESSAGRVVGQ